MSPYSEFASLDYNKIFLLDAKEVTKSSYGYYNSYEDAKCREKRGGIGYWWLRLYLDGDPGFVNYIDVAGWLGNIEVDVPYVGVSPALNIDRSSILFASEIEEINANDGTSYKLTIIDDAMSVNITEGSSVGINEDVLSIPYTIVNDSANNICATQLSYFITDRPYNENKVQMISYGKLIDIDENTLSGNVELDLVSALAGTTYSVSDIYKLNVYIFAENVNGDKETDYASSPQIISMQKITLIEDVSITITEPLGGTVLYMTIPQQRRRF